MAGCWLRLLHANHTYGLWHPWTFARSHFRLPHHIYPAVPRMPIVYLRTGSRDGYAFQPHLHTHPTCPAVCTACPCLRPMGHFPRLPSHTSHTTPASYRFYTPTPPSDLDCGIPHPARPTPPLGGPKQVIPRMPQAHLTSCMTPIRTHAGAQGLQTCSAHSQPCQSSPFLISVCSFRRGAGHGGLRGRSFWAA